MSIGYTSLLALVQPVDGTEVGTWGDDVNNGVSSILDVAVAGTQNITTDANVTLTITQATSSGTNLSSTSAQYAILLLSGARTATRTITLPASSKTYTVMNSTTGGYAQTVGGLTIAVGEYCQIAYNTSSSSWVKTSTFSGAGTFSSITNTSLTSGRVVYSTTGGLETDSSSFTFDGTTLTAPSHTFNTATTGSTNKGPLNYGTLSFSDTGIVQSSQTSVNSYFQNVIQNTSAGTAASAEFIAYNDQGTATTNYATVGINSSGYSGTGSINAPGYGYFLTASTDLVLGTIGANAIHFTTNSAAADAMTISSSNVVSIVKDASIHGLTVGLGGSSGTANSAFGLNALSANTTGTYNSGFGSGVLQNNTTGSGLNAFGQGALFTNTTGNENTAIGGSKTVYAALYYNTSGSYNVAVGGGALQSNTTASNNTAVGYQSLYSNTTGTNLIAFGYQAGYNVNASNNIAIGLQAMYGGTVTGTSNIAIGNSDGTYNPPMRYLTSGTFNVGIGNGALASNGTNFLTGSYNTALGHAALYSNTTSNNNTAVGYQAAYSNTTGQPILAVGYQTLYANTTGVQNVGVGNVTLGNNTTGGYNTSIGHQSLAQNTTSNNNTAVGYQAGYSQTTFGANTFIGYQAGYTQNNTSAYTYNTFVGYQAGYATTTAVKCTILGGYSGNQGGLDIRTASNYIVLSDGDGNPRGIFDNSGNFLVGTTSSTTTPASGVQLNNGSSIGTVAVGHASGTATGNYFATFSYNSGIIGSITQNGISAVLYNITSDQRLKENIQDADDASALVDSLKVRQFDWKSDGSHQRYGFVAQELAAVAPEAVYQPADPEEMMAVDYSKLVPMLVKEIQSLRKRLAALEAK